MNDFSEAKGGLTTAFTNAVRSAQMVPPETSSDQDYYLLPSTALTIGCILNVCAFDDRTFWCQQCSSYTKLAVSVVRKLFGYDDIGYHLIGQASSVSESIRRVADLRLRL